MQTEVGERIDVSITCDDATCLVFCKKSLDLVAENTISGYLLVTHPSSLTS